MKWTSNPNRYGPIPRPQVPFEGEARGIDHDRYTRTPAKKEDRRAYSHQLQYRFVEFVNAMLDQDWPPDEPPPDPARDAVPVPQGKPVYWTPMRAAPGQEKVFELLGLEGFRLGIIQPEIIGRPMIAGRQYEIGEFAEPNTPEYAQQKLDSERTKEFYERQERQVLTCVTNAVRSVQHGGFGGRILSAYNDRRATENESEPSHKTIETVARYARRVADVLTEAVVALANGRAIPPSVWWELIVRGGPVVVTASGDPPGPRNRKVCIEFQDCAHVIDDLRQPGEIIAYAVEAMVASFFAYLTKVSLGSDETLRCCQHRVRTDGPQCGRILVGRGKRWLCEIHQGDKTAARQRARSRESELSAEWANTSGNWERRSELLRKYFGDDSDFGAILNRFQRMGHREITPTNCSYKTALKWWRKARNEVAE